MVDLLSVPPRGRQHLVLRVDAGLRGGELRRPLGGVFAARTNEYGRKMNGELSGLRTPRVLPLAGGGVPTGAFVRRTSARATWWTCSRCPLGGANNRRAEGRRNPARRTAHPFGKALHCPPHRGAISARVTIKTQS